MQCLSCATELLHPANFCPVCGARLAAPVPDGSAATVQGGMPGPPGTTARPVDADAEGELHYLPGSSGVPVPPNPRAGDYAAQEAVPDPVQPPDPVDMPEPPPRVTDNPYGDFFADGPSAWLEDDDEHEEGGEGLRPVGTLVAIVGLASFAAAWVVWGMAMWRGAGGAEAGGFLLIALVAWWWYLQLRQEQQHRAMLRLDAWVARRVERVVRPLQSRTEEQLQLRRERDRYRAMRDERTRRVAALGEAAFRAFRTGGLPVDLHDKAQRVMAMEQQMLLQDHRIHTIVTATERSTSATDADEPGQPPA